MLVFCFESEHMLELWFSNDEKNYSIEDDNFKDYTERFERNTGEAVFFDESDGLSFKYKVINKDEYEKFSIIDGYEEPCLYTFIDEGNERIYKPYYDELIDTKLEITDDCFEIEEIEEMNYKFVIWDYYKHYRLFWFPNVYEFDKSKLKIKVSGYELKDKSVVYYITEMFYDGIKAEEDECQTDPNEMILQVFE